LACALFDVYALTATSDPEGVSTGAATPIPECQITRGEPYLIIVSADSRFVVRNDMRRYVWAGNQARWIILVVVPKRHLVESRVHKPSARG
jgi:hypothetical protein